MIPYAVQKPDFTHDDDWLTTAICSNKIIIDMSRSKDSLMGKFATTPFPMMTTQKAFWFQPEQWACLTQNLPVFRGTGQTKPERTVQVASPQDRIPVSMPKLVQKEIDDCFEKMFGLRFRQKSLFVTGSFDVAEGYAKDYGEVRTIRPSAPFCFCWGLHSKDLYFEYMEMPHGESIEDLITRLDFRTSDLIQAIQLGHEIMLVGESFGSEKI